MKVYMPVEESGPIILQDKVFDILNFIKDIYPGALQNCADTLEEDLLLCPAEDEVIYRAIIKRVKKEIANKKPAKTILRVQLPKENELLAVLKEVSDWWIGGDCPPDLWAKMQAVIAKAERAK